MWYQMKRKHGGYILAALFLSLCSHVVHIVSVMTESWVVAEASPDGSSGNVSFINYGLFKGALVRRQDESTEERFDLTMTCLLYLNVCAWTCQSWDSLRRDEVSALYYTGQASLGCDHSVFNYSRQHFVRRLLVESVSTKPLSQVRKAFIDGVAWLATLVAVTLSGLVSLAAFSLTAYNINHIPSNGWVSITSLYFWFGTSSVLAALALTAWGFEFVFKLSVNVGTVDTIVGSLDSCGKARLGYSYWRQLGVVGLQGCSLALLYYRETLFDQRRLFITPLKVSPTNLVSSPS